MEAIRGFSNFHPWEGEGGRANGIILKRGAQPILRMIYYILGGRLAVGLRLELDREPPIVSLPLR